MLETATFEKNLLDFLLQENREDRLPIVDKRQRVEVDKSRFRYFGEWDGNELKLTFFEICGNMNWRMIEFNAAYYNIEPGRLHFYFK